MSGRHTVDKRVRCCVCVFVYAGKREYASTSVFAVIFAFLSLRQSFCFLKLPETRARARAHIHTQPASQKENAILAGSCPRRQTSPSWSSPSPSDPLSLTMDLYNYR